MAKEKTQLFKSEDEMNRRKKHWIRTDNKRRYNHGSTP